ncbi:MAG: hypothetical protein ACM3ZB_14355 [bacterium]|jgi:hypothetical protein
MRLALVAAIAIQTAPLALSIQLSELSEALGRLGKTMTVAEVRIQTEPADRRIRPFETMVVQVRAYGLEGDKKVRLRRSVTQVRVADSGGGWVSKPFSSQTEDQDDPFHDESSSAGWNIFRSAAGQFVNKDCVLYTAPETPGTYRIEADVEGKQASVEVVVAANAPSRRPAETVSFPPERPDDPYRPLVERYAPFIAQETWFTPKADIPVRFDFDGDWHGDNNWESLDTGSSQAYVYYAVMETSTHWFLIYNLFHPRDYSDRCVIGTCHENDNEGLILTVQKDGSPFGRLQVMETLAHDNVYSFTADPAIRGGVHDIDGGIEFYEGTHPAVFVESGGHGIYGTLAKASLFSLKSGEFASGTGITLVYKGVAERPRHGNDRLVGYDLLPIYSEWWLKAERGKWQQRTFDDYVMYRPFGGRPAIPFAIGSTFLGRKEAENKAKPFWGWHDRQTLKQRVLAAGQWGLDPAYAVSRNLRFPAGTPFSLDYTFNPYLGIGAPQAVAAPAGPQQDAAARTGGQVEIAARIDGVAELILYGETGRWEIVSGQAVTEQQAEFSAPLPEAPGLKWSVAKQAGRGSVELVQTPSAENGYTAIIRIEDPQSGADFYRLRLSWE